MKFGVEEKGAAAQNGAATGRGGARGLVENERPALWKVRAF
jgi:hypothetical protein